MTTTTTTSSYDYDYLVIGGGSGGVSSAKRAATLYNKRVAVVEGARWGGTCVNVGCVPKKIMYQTAAIYETVTHTALQYEIAPTTSNGSHATASSSFQVDWKALKDKRGKYIVRLNNIYLNGLKKKVGVDVVEGWASLVDAHTVQVASNDGDKATPSSKTITAEHILIATGGKPVVPPGGGVALLWLNCADFVLRLHTSALDVKIDSTMTAFVTHRLVAKQFLGQLNVQHEQHQQKQHRQLRHM